jgi:hypothetical protein
MTDPNVPASLLRAVTRDLHPVRPLWSPARRALVLLPVGVALLVAIPAFWGWRVNLDVLGVGGAWGLSTLQAFAGLVIIGAALREAVPGRPLSAAAIAATTGAAALLFVAITVVTQHVAPVVMPRGVWLRYAWECFGVEAASGVPAVAAVAWLAARALPTRPFVAGSLYGLGAALLADAGMRLFCRVSTPSHVLFSHGAAILCLALGGAAAASATEALKARRSRRQR